MKAFVSGATGFLGGRLARRLIADGFSEVTGGGRDPEAGAALEREGVRFLRGDLADPELGRAAAKGQTFIFHCAALSSPWGKRAAFERANVAATESLLAGCAASPPARFIHVSTPSIYFDFRDRVDIKESEPLPAKMVNHYAATKLLAEERVLAASDQGLPAVILRPRGIFGPGDTALFPRLLRAHHQGRLFQLAGRDPLVDLSYVDNVIDALCLCREAPERALGRAYNITNGEPVRLYALLRQVLGELDPPPRLKSMPYRAAAALAAGLEMFGALTGREPALTRYTLGLLAFDQTLDISAAREDLGYQPEVSMAQGVENFVSWWREGRDGA